MKKYISLAVALFVGVVSTAPSHHNHSSAHQVQHKEEILNKIYSQIDEMEADLRFIKSEISRFEAEQANQTESVDSKATIDSSAVAENSDKKAEEVAVSNPLRDEDELNVESFMNSIIIQNAATKKTKKPGEGTVFGDISKVIADWFKAHDNPTDSQLDDLIDTLRQYGINAHTNKGQTALDACTQFAEQSQINQITRRAQNQDTWK
ncbi:UNKNOWN [Stylonychia lemnae]|uniref:Uncharacterized protein n=1 Tax=Stylonychia lemnae TaxID=5949 RepID=A0A078B594_STYLE|nr:UNKNOWN [Stylonychia lemnae]|eukprot:CDW88708.1 UNKNOWN [Stylonychia lemnae]